MNVSLFRRVALGVAVLGISGVGFMLPSVATTHASSAGSVLTSDFQSRLDALARRARPGILGVVVLDLAHDESWSVNGNHAFPMMSVFKVPLAATVLALVDCGELSLERTITITRKDLRSGASRIAKTFHGDSMIFSVEKLLTEAVSHSDNTAADALVKLIGGPRAVTDFLKAHGIRDMRVDLDERGIEHVFSGLGSAEYPPGNETVAERDTRLRRGYQAFLDDPRNRSTPYAAASFLRKLWVGELLSAASTKRLLDLMHGQTKPVRLRAGVPSKVRLASKAGTSLSMDGMTAAYNDVGILTWPDGRIVIITAFLTASKAAKIEREALFADLAREAVEALHP